jgi:hypothetical protein
MHFKKFCFLYLGLLAIGLVILGLQDILFIYSAESQLAKVDHYVPGKVETYYKLGGSYQEQTLTPVINYSVGGQTYSTATKYSCKDGCHKVGSDITIFYQKPHPDILLISSFEGMWKFKVYFLILMAVLLLTSLPYLYYSVNKQPESE